MIRDRTLTATLAVVEGFAVFLAAYVTAGVAMVPALDALAHTRAAPVQAGLASLFTVAAFYFTDLYDLRAVPKFGHYISRLFRAGILAVILLVGVLTLVTEKPAIAYASHIWILMTAIGTTVIVIRGLFYALLRFDAFSERTLIVGDGALARELVAEINSRPGCGYALVGVVGRCNAIPANGSREWLIAPLEDAQRTIDELQPERVIVALAELRGHLPMHQLVGARISRGVAIEEGVDVYERLTGKLAIESLTPSRVIFSSDFRPSVFPLAIARGISIFASAMGLIGLLPLLALIALAIKLDSRGPILFFQDRIGRGGRRFVLLKFRTMHPAVRQHSEWVRDNGHRITRVGRWLRKFRLDELPQLVNVLRGDMNIVGPRPHPASNFEMLALVSRNTPECGLEIPFYSLRSMIRPGITGWAQVRYRYANDLDEEMEKLRYDLYYVKHLSLGLDLCILLETIKVVLCGRGAEGAENVTRQISDQQEVTRGDMENPMKNGRSRTVRNGRLHASDASMQKGVNSVGSNVRVSGMDVSGTETVECLGGRRVR